MDVRWEDGFEIRVSADEGGAIVSANPEGLRSLAAILEELAEDEPGTHIHLDEHNSLEDGSCELVIERI